jgi:hypothetical protein
MMVKLLEGKPLITAIHNNRRIVARDKGWNGITRPEQSATERNAKPKTLTPNFLRLDKTKDDDEMSAHERVASDSQANTNVNIEVINPYHARRATILSDSVEAMLSQFNNGNRAIATITGFHVRTSLHNRTA